MDNLNLIVDLECSWSIFWPFGRVRDISFHRGRRDRHIVFAFLRFATKEKTMSVVQKTNGMHVYSWLIACKMVGVG